jgi:hypothetical protein
MNLGKALVLVAGLAGVAAFFLPLAEGEDDGTTARVVAYDLVRGVDPVRGPDGVARRIDWGPNFERNRGIFVGAFAPGGLLLLVGLLALAARFGRGLAALALVFALLAGAVWAIFDRAFAEVEDPLWRGPGYYLLLACAAGGTIGAIYGLARPERRRVAVETAPGA